MPGRRRPSDRSTIRCWYSQPRSNQRGSPIRTSAFSSRISIKTSSTTIREPVESVTMSSDAVRNQRSPLVLTERNDHLDKFEQALASRCSSSRRPAPRDWARNNGRPLRDRLAAIPSDEERVILATGKYIGEGFDDPRLDTLFLTLPVSWRGTIAQYTGRCIVSTTASARCASTTTPI